jgi:ribonuclease D
MQSSDVVDDFQICDRDLSPEMLALYLQAESLAVDTETMGLDPHRDRLCLVQLCDPVGRVTVLRIAQGQRQAPHLKQLLEASEVTKIFHFARFDIATLLHHLDIAVQPLFCTKIASKLARTYSPRHGLKELIRELEGIDLDKTAQSSDWGNAINLTEEQLRYAANDVRYLIPARIKLTQMLQREGRWPLAEACFGCLPTLSNLDLQGFEAIFEH